MRLGMIGLGAMGKPIAKHLQKGDSPLIAYSRNDGVALELKREGVAVTSCLHDMSRSELLFLCLPNGEIVWDILFGKDGIARELAPETIVVDLGTTSQMKTIEISNALKNLSIHFMDAPISGLEQRAKEGTLTIMCGGNPQIFARVKPYFEMFGRNILLMGGDGAGQLTKLINNLLYDINVAALAEILPLSAKLGLDPAQVSQVINNGTGRSHASEFFVPKILEGNFNSSYPMTAAYKDLVSGAEICAHQKIPLPVLMAATTTYQMALLKGYGDHDKGGMIRVYEDLLDVEFRTAPPSTPKNQ